MTTEPTPEPSPLEFTDVDAPTVPNHEASQGFKAEDVPRRSNGFRDFASRAAKRGSNGRKSSSDMPLVVQQIPNRKGQFVEPLMKLYGGIGTMMIPFDPVCGTAILQSAEACARSIDELAYRNEAVRRVIWYLCQTSTLGVVIVAHLPIIMAVLTHHVPAVQQFAGKMTADMMEEFLKQSTPQGDNS